MTAIIQKTVQLKKKRGSVMNKLDYKKEFKDLYNPKTTPSVIDVPAMKFIQISGRGSPNEPEGEYQKAVELLYALTYTIKMSAKFGDAPKDYVDYVVPPLEGLWWIDSGDPEDFTQKSKYCWISMIRQPDFVNEEMFLKACNEVENKKHLDTEKAVLTTFTEGLCVQCMHIGPFDDEPATIEKIKAFIKENRLACDLSDTRKHHEIYLSDPRKINTDKMRTILRYPVRKA